MLFARREKEKLQPLEEHLKNVYIYSKRIAEINKIDVEEEVLKLLAFLHDVGKADKKWQSSFPKVEKYPHALLGLPLAYAFLKKNNIEEELKFLILSIILSHHRGLKKGMYEGKYANLNANYAEEIFDILRKAKIEIERNDVNNLLLERKYDGAKWKEKPLTCLDIQQKCIDFLERLKKEEMLEFREKFWKLQGILVEADFLDVKMWEESLSEENVFQQFYFPSFHKLIESKQPKGKYEWQKSCLECSYKYIIIPMPTGTGKTEASLFWASRVPTKRLFYVLPVTFAINAMFKRFQSYFKNVGIYHHWADVFLREEDTEQLDSYLYFKTMISSVQVTTPDQIILSFLQWKKWTVKLLSFLNSTFIFDEIHVYDPLLFSHFRLLIEKLKKEFNANICIITATFPFRLREFKEMENFIVLPRDWEKYYERKFGKISYIKEKIEDWLNANKNKLREEWKNKKILIVVNTVKKAQDLYELLKELSPMLLHARFILGDRIKKEKDVLNEKPRILIATQIVEVSLDIDYDILLTEICPLDSLIQRMGRVNRNRDREGEIFVFYTEDWNPYEKKVFERAKEYIEKSVVNKKSDKELLDVFQKYYGEISSLFTKKYEEAKRTWEMFSTDVYSFSIDESSLKGLLREIKVINIPVIPQIFEECAHRLKDEARKLWNQYKEFLNKKAKKKALEKEIEIRKLVVEVPIFRLKDSTVKFDKDLKFFVANLKYDTQVGLKGVDIENVL